MSDIIEIYRRAAICRAFEEECLKRVKSGEIACPYYCSAGQEYIAATLSYYLEKHNPAIFPQHRNHAQYLCFGGDMGHLIRELTGRDTGMQGSASIAHGSIFGHDGMMGSNVPISVGYCDATKCPTICFIGDAAAEEDYVLGALGWAATRNLPILFVVEDNGLAILTEKDVRRSWDIVEVARGFGLRATTTPDHPIGLEVATFRCWLNLPALMNVETTRLYWHAGAGKDGDYFDHHAEVAKQIQGTELIDIEARNQVEQKWRLETQFAR